MGLRETLEARLAGGHDDVHVVLAELGDISVEPPSMETIRNANKAALKALKARLAELGHG